MVIEDTAKLSAHVRTSSTSRDHQHQHQQARISSPCSSGKQKPQNPSKTPHTQMAPATPFNAAEITEKARRDLLLLLEGVR
jgi:hypothetical protein